MSNVRTRPPAQRACSKSSGFTKRRRKMIEALKFFAHHIAPIIIIGGGLIAAIGILNK